MKFDLVNKEHILQGIKDFEVKGFPDGFGPSTSYDVIHEGKTYPPKAIMAYANFHAKGELPENNFKGGEGTECFLAFERCGYYVKEKAPIIEVLEQFLSQAQTENLKTKHYLKTFKGLKLKVSFGAGNAAKIPWIALLKPPNKVQDGIYPVFLYYKEVDKLILAYGVSETNTSNYSWDDSSSQSISDWFNENYNRAPDRYGDSKIKAIYDVNNIDYASLKTDFDNIINTYKKIEFADLTNEPNPAYNLFDNNDIFTWVKTHKLLTEYLLTQEHSQKELISLLKEAGATMFNDKNPKDTIVPLEEMDPFTFYCYIYKYGPEKRLDVLQNIAKSLKLFVPRDERGVPSANAQKVWLFPYKYHRTNNEIKRLWDFFKHAINHTITDEIFQNILDIKNVGRTKITEALFYIDPEYHFPINGPTIPYLQKVLDINPDFNSFTEYKNILNQIKKKSDKPNYQISYEAWVWNDNQDEDLKDFENSIDNNAVEDLIFYFDYLDELVQFLDLKINDERVVYSSKGEYFNFNIGQRVAWRIDPKSRREAKFHIMLDKHINENSGSFDGALDHFYHVFIPYQKLQELKTSSFRASKAELKRTSRSGYRRHNNKYFEKAVFDKEFRNKYINKIMNKEINKTMKGRAFNKILYGPPGTGKTYALKQKYFPLYTTKETSITAEKNFENIIKERSWWEVIAVALLQLGTSKVKDIYDHKWVRKKAEMSNSKTVKPTIWGQLQSHTVESCEYINVKSKQQPLIFNKTEDSAWEVQKEEIENQIPELYEIIKNVEDFRPNPDKTIGRYRFVTFHQSFSYEDFIEGIKPIMPENGEVSEDLGYKIEDGVFKDICKDAELDPNNRYAIFIDEINRGNVSAIFGELITLIEIDKRNGAANEMSITLPYSKKQFSVPANLDIYGTMNTADRSVEALDTALRRRFEFVEMMPDLNIISNEKVEDVLLSEILKVINQRIELLIDRDHTIGHSYFVNIITKKGLASAFNNKIVPLLQEYFYGDYGKIGLVLGKGFVEKQKNDSVEFAHFDYENANDFKIPSFILKPVTENTVMEAVKLLLGNIDD